MQNGPSVFTNPLFTCPTSTVTLKTFFVEDNATIRENLIETLLELTDVELVGYAET